VLSGGQAAGGHNVIMGIFDMLKKMNPESRVYGFLMGPHGVYSNNYMEICGDYMNLYRNMGGFDMICKSFCMSFNFTTLHARFPIFMFSFENGGHEYKMENCLLL